MEQFKKLHSHSKFTENIADISAFLDKAVGKINLHNPNFMDPDKTKDENEINVQILKTELGFDATGLKTQLNSYNNFITLLYTQKNNKYPSLTADALSTLKTKASDLVAQIENVTVSFVHGSSSIAI